MKSRSCEGLAAKGLYLLFEICKKNLLLELCCIYMYMFMIHGDFLGTGT